VTVVDKNADRLGTRKVAEAYLKYLYSPEGQKIAAKNFYRPSDRRAVDAELLQAVCRIEVVQRERCLRRLAKTRRRTHFADKGVFDQIYAAK